MSLDGLVFYQQAANDFVIRKSDFIGKATIMEANYGFLNKYRFKRRIDTIRNMTGGEVDSNAQIHIIRNITLPSDTRHPIR
jgi:hypothetical protein